MAIRGVPFALCGLLCAWGLGAGVGRAQSITFDDLSPGTLFGAANDPPQSVVYARHGIEMAVDSFFLNSYVGYQQAEVGGIYSSAFATPSLELNNICVVFTFPGVGFAVTELSLEFVEFGGAVNIGVNNGPLWELDTLHDLPADVAPGVLGEVSAHVVTIRAPASAITSLRIGGQELVIDNLSIVPEPVTWALVLGGSALIALRQSNRRGLPSLRPVR